MSAPAVAGQRLAQQALALFGEEALLADAVLLQDLLEAVGVELAGRNPGRLGSRITSWARNVSDTPSFRCAASLSRAAVCSRLLEDGLVDAERARLLGREALAGLAGIFCRYCWKARLNCSGEISCLPTVASAPVVPNP